MTRVRLVLDSFGCEGHDSSKDLNLLGVLGLGSGNVDFDLISILEGLFGIVSPRLAGYYYKVIAMDSEPNILFRMVKMARAGNPSLEPSVGEGGCVVFTPSLCRIERSVHCLF